jgi:hypothetical protein
MCTVVDGMFSVLEPSARIEANQRPTLPARLLTRWPLRTGRTSCTGT